MRGQYSQSMSIDLLLAAQWEDERWPLTQHRTFRLLRPPPVAQPPVLTSRKIPRHMLGPKKLTKLRYCNQFPARCLSPSTDAVSSERLVSVTLGSFAADVALQKVTVDGGGGLRTWTERTERTQDDVDLRASRLPHSNGSHSYLLQIPLSHPKIIPEVRTMELLCDLFEDTRHAA